MPQLKLTGAQKLMASIGQLLRRVRKVNQLTQLDLASQVGLDLRHYQDIEAGRSNVKLETLRRIAHCYRLSVQELFSCGVQKTLKSSREFEQFKRERLLLQSQSERKRFLKEWDSYPFAIQVWDLKGRITFANKADRAIHGFSRRDVKDKQAFWSLVMNEDEREYLRSYFCFLMQHQPPSFYYTTLLRHHDGNPVPVNVDWDYLRDQNGVLLGLAVAVFPFPPAKQLHE